MMYLNAQANTSTCELINLWTRKLTKRGISHFTPLPTGEGKGEGSVVDGIILEQIGF